MKAKHGDYMPLTWECYTEEYYVKGHVDFEEGAKTIQHYEGRDISFGTPFYAYGRWSMEKNEDLEWAHNLRTYQEKGRGRFPITVYPNKAVK